MASLGFPGPCSVSPVEVVCLPRSPVEVEESRGERSLADREAGGSWPGVAGRGELTDCWPTSLPMGGASGFFLGLPRPLRLCVFHLGDKPVRNWFCDCVGNSQSRWRMGDGAGGWLSPSHQLMLGSLPFLKSLLTLLIPHLQVIPRQQKTLNLTSIVCNHAVNS